MKYIFHFFTLLTTRSLNLEKVILKETKYYKYYIHYNMNFSLNRLLIKVIMQAIAL